MNQACAKCCLQYPDLTPPQCDEFTQMICRLIQVDYPTAALRGRYFRERYLARQVEP